MFGSAIYWCAGSPNNSDTVFFFTQIFVVDSADMMRMDETGEVIYTYIATY